MKARVAVAVLSMSAAAFVARVTHEGYTDGAVIPTQGDRPTVGFGSTFHEDGRPVQMGDRTDPIRAVRLALAHIQRDEPKLKQCIGPDVKLHQAEFDVYVEMAYNIGTYNFCTNPSTGGPGLIVRKLRAGDYKGACDAILAYKYAAGYDCSQFVNGMPNKRCYGVWKDRLRLHEQCMAVQ